MGQNSKKQQSVSSYEINNKKYTVITSCVEGSEDVDKLYDVLCKFAISKLDNEFNETIDILC